MPDFPASTLPPDTAACGQCGCTLPPDGVPGLCPRCELSLALEGPNDADLPVRGELGGYEMIEEAGRGGMGSVWKARQPGLGRLVAIKILPGGEWAGESQRLRFQREAEAAARLRHPHLVAVHDCGEHEGTLWYSMDFIEGESLAARIQRAPLAAREAATLMEKVTRAVAFAHSQGVWHRDLKPANILVDAAGEPHVTDFGLAHTEASTGLTVSGHLAGSPHYLPPERAQGGNGDAPATAGDIYALGATLYHALTGRPPFSGPNVSAILAKVIADPPARPAALQPDIPRDLETICLKCLEKSPGRRYATAGALADDLQRFLDGAPVQARPISAPARLWRWARRRPALAGLVLALTLALAGLFTLLAWSAQRSRTEAERLKTAATAAEKAEHAAQIESGLAAARSARLSDQFASRAGGLQSLAAAAGLAAATRDETVRRTLRDEAAALLALPVTDWSERIGDPRVPHEGSWWIERTRQWRMMRGPGEQGWLLGAAEGDTAVPLPVTEAHFSTTCSRDGRYAYTKPGDDPATEGTFWRIAPPQATALHKARGRVLDWSPDNTRSLRVTPDGYSVNEIESGRLVCRFPCLTFSLFGRFSNDGRHVAVPAYQFANTEHARQMIFVFDAASGIEKWRAPLSTQPAALCWNHEDTWVAAMDALGRIHTFSAVDGHCSHIMPQPGGSVQGPSTPCLEYTRDGFLASLSPRNTVTLWDAGSGRALRSQIATGWHSGGLRGGHDFGPLSSRLVPPSWLHIRRGAWRSVPVPSNGEQPLNALTWSPDGRLLAAGHERGSWLWDSGAQQLRGPVSAPVAGDWCLNLEFLTDKTGFVAAYRSGLWRQVLPHQSARSAAVPLQLDGVRESVMARAAQAPLTAVAGRFPDEKYYVLLIPSGKPADMRRRELPAAPSALALNPAGTRLAVGLQSRLNSLALLDTADFRVVQEWPQLGGAPHALDFDPAGRLLSFAVYNAHLADAETGVVLGEFSSWSQTDGLFGSPTAAFDPSGKWYAVTDPPRRIILHRRGPESAAAPTGWQSFLTLESPSAAGITRLSFSPDGQQLAAATTRPAFELWDLAALEAELRRMGIW